MSARSLVFLLVTVSTSNVVFHSFTTQFGFKSNFVSQLMIPSSSIFPVSYTSYGMNISMRTFDIFLEIS